MNENESMLTRWADGELSGDELMRFEETMGRDGALRAEAEAARRVGEALRAGLDAEIEPPAAELFNGHVAKRIAEEARADAGGARRASGRGRPPLRLAPWLVAAAACLVAALAMLQRSGPADPGAGSVAGVYTPDPAVEADVYFDAEARATVILLQGLEDVPAGREVRPHSVASHGPEGGAGRTVFYSAEEPSRALFVLLGSGRGEPSLHEVR
jgi:hypothetical protein